MKTRIIKAVAIALVICLLLVVLTFFIIPVHPFKDTPVLHASVTSTESTQLNAPQTEQLNKLLDKAHATRCFAPSNLSETDDCLLVDITTINGPMHLHFGDKAYAYTLSDDSLWYSINDADMLRSEIEKIIK